MQGLKGKKHIVFIVAALSLLAVVSWFFGWVWAQNLLTFSALLVIAVNIYKNIIEPQSPRIHWILTCLSVFLWLLCEILWFLNSKLLARPYEQYEFIAVAYLLPLFGILVAASYYFYIKILATPERNIVLLDTTSVFLLLSTLFFSKIFSFDFSQIFSSISNFTAFAAILISFLTLFVLLSELFSTNIIIVQTSSFYLLVASLLFSAMNLYIYYGRFGVPPSEYFYISPLYLLPFGTMMTGALYLKTANLRVRADALGLNTGSKWLPFIAVVPLLIQGNFGSATAFFVLFVLVSHALASYYVKSSLSNQKLLENEKMLHQELEKVMHERTNELTLANLRLQDITQRDYLTGLGSRSFLIDSLQEMNNKLVAGQALGIYYLNIRHFKALNAAYGHEIGDKILKSVAKRLADICQNQEIIARIGADEFIIVSKIEQSNSDECMEFGESIKQYIGQNLQIERYHFSLEIIVGIHIVTTQNKNSAQNLIKNADRAMYHAKENPAFNPTIYDKALDARSLREARMETLLKTADFKSEFELVFEPVFDIATDKMLLAQASLVWRSTEFGTLSQEEFIEVIKNKDTLNEIFEFALSNLLNQLKIWREQGIKPPKISLNIASRQVLSEAFVHIVKRVLKAYALEADELEFEIDEMIWTAQADAMERIFSVLKWAKIGVCIDDFGVGYSSLVFIKKYDTGRIKIARELVQNLARNNIDEQIVAAIVQLAKAMNLKVTAKAVNEAEILDILRRFGCDLAQGEYLSKPLSVAKFEALI